MRTIPQISKPADPVGADLAISGLQDRLATIQYTVDSQTLNWFDNGLIFGIAQRDENKNIPILYWKNKEYFETFFDNYKAHCFFYEIDPRNVDGRSLHFNFHLVVCYQQQLIKRHLNYSVQESFIDTILTKVMEPELTELDFQTIQVFTDTNTVFNNYDIQKMTSIFKQDEYSCFRISFTHQEQIACKDLVI